MICLIGNREVQLQCRTACGEGYDSSAMVDVIAACQEEYLETFYAAYLRRITLYIIFLFCSVLSGHTLKTHL